MALSRKCVEIVKRLKAQKQVDYISFSYEACLEVIELDKKAKVSFLEGNRNIPIYQLKKDGFAGLDYNIHIYRTHPQYFQEARKLGLTTNIWTVNKEEDMIWAMNMGADLITSDEPELLLKLLNKNYSRKENKKQLKSK